MTQTSLLKWTDLQPGDRVVSTDGFAGVVLATMQAEDVVGRAQIHWEDGSGEITWIRPDMLQLGESAAQRATVKTAMLRALRAA